MTDARHDPDAPGSFDATFGGIDCRVKQVNNNAKKSVIIYALTPGAGVGSVYRLYEFHRLHDTGEVVLPASVGFSRALYLWLDGRYGVRRMGSRPQTTADLAEEGV